MNLVLDIETNSEHTQIWLCYTHNSDTNEYVCHTKPDTLIPLINKADRIIGHNLIAFDAPVLNKLWGTKIGLRKATDTLIMSRLLTPSIENGHSLKAWGKRLGNDKVDYAELWHQHYNLDFDKKNMEPYDVPLMGLLDGYCKQDVAVTVQLYEQLSKSLEDWGESVDLEHKVAAIIERQKRHGFKFNTKKAQILLASLSGEVADIEGELQSVFPPITTKRVSEKTGKELADKVTVFNPGSRQQIVERLESTGVMFFKRTDKGSKIVDETVLSSIDRPEAKLISRYLMIHKRISQINSWFDAVKSDGRVHGSVITNGAVTGRMTHMSPNMAQVPNSNSEYGSECRELWEVEEGNVLVGADASGLELRMLAHYMRDKRYIKTVCEGRQDNGTDVHTMNMKAAGLTNRNQAKTFIYAFLYGAGPAKIGSVINGSAYQGRTLIRRFLRNTPALDRLKQKLGNYSENGWLPGLDGRRLEVRSEHAALNTLLQGAGAILMKKALIILDTKLKTCGIIASFCANVHDEWQIEAKREDSELVGQLAVESIEEAGKHFKLRCPTTGEWKCGTNWKETH